MLLDNIIVKSRQQNVIIGLRHTYIISCQSRNTVEDIDRIRKDWFLSLNCKFYSIIYLTTKFT